MDIAVMSVAQTSGHSAEDGRIDAVLQPFLPSTDRLRLEVVDEGVLRHLRQHPPQLQRLLERLRLHPPQPQRLLERLRLHLSQPQHRPLRRVPSPTPSRMAA